MNKTTIIKCIIWAAVLFGAYTFFFGSEAEAQEVTKTWQIDAEVGQYEKRIDTGLYTGDDANYVKLGTDLGVLGGLSFVGDLEYVDTEDYQLYTTVGTVLGTPLGDLGVSGQYTTIENGSELFELGASYGVNLLGVDGVVDVTIDNDGQYFAQISTEYALYSDELFTVSVGGVYGQSFETSDDYEYTLGYARVDAPLGVTNLFVQLNYLNSDLAAGTNGEWESTTDFGLSLSF